MDIFWLVELVGDFPSLYWGGDGPGDWCAKANHAVKFHDRAAAEAAAKSLQVPGAHKVEAREHAWVP